MRDGSAGVRGAAARMPARVRVACALMVLGASAACAVTRPSPTAPVLPPVTAGALRDPAVFAVIRDDDRRAAALFEEASRVLLHPRCVNCHPAGDSPTQGDALSLHDPPVFRGDHDRGVPALECSSCHQEHNLELARVPGAPEWHLAPREMAWARRSTAQICAQIKDRSRNGGRDLAQIVEHSAHDALVGWGWAPGHGRTPAPGNQAQLGALMQAWVDAGAACPEEGTP